MLTAKQKELYDLITTNNIPAFETKENYYIVYRSNVSIMTQYIYYGYERLQEAKEKEQYVKWLEKLKAVIEAYYQIFKVDSIDLKEFLSKLDEEDIEFATDVINNIYQLRD